jgi:hypothetical protein
MTHMHKWGCLEKELKTMIKVNFNEAFEKFLGTNNPHA